MIFLLSCSSSANAVVTTVMLHTINQRGANLSFLGDAGACQGDTRKTGATLIVEQLYAQNWLQSHQ